MRQLVTTSKMLYILARTYEQAIEYARYRGAALAEYRVISGPSSARGLRDIIVTGVGDYWLRPDFRAIRNVLLVQNGQIRDDLEW